MSKGKILIIDDEVEVRGFLQDYLEDREYQVVAASDGQQGWEFFQKENFDLVICDMMMPRMMGVEFLRLAKGLKPDQKIIMMTGVKEESMVAKAKALGCTHYLTKPVGLSAIEAKVSECLPS